MRLRRLLLLSALVVVVPAAVFGTGGFSETVGQRGIEVAVADDDEAFLGISVEAADGYVGGDPMPVVRLTDRFSGDLVLQEVSAGSQFVEVETETEPSPDIGRTDPLTVEASCEATGSANVRFTVVAEGSGAHVSAERAAPVTCREPEVHRVEFDECGKARIEADDAIYPLDVAKVVEHPNASGTATITATIDSDGRVRAARGGTLVAIEADGDRYENGNRCTDGGTGRPNGTGNQ